MNMQDNNACMQKRHKNSNSLPIIHLPKTPLPFPGTVPHLDYSPFYTGGTSNAASTSLLLLSSFFLFFLPLLRLLWLFFTFSLFFSGFSPLVSAATLTGSRTLVTVTVSMTSVTSTTGVGQALPVPLRPFLPEPPLPSTAAAAEDDEFCDFFGFL